MNASHMKMANLLKKSIRVLVKVKHGFKWLKRSQLDGEDWAKGQSRKPHRIPKRINEAMEQAVIETRKHLEWVATVNVSLKASLPEIL